MFQIPIILASKSPRRQELMRTMDLKFQVELREVDESYPDGLSPHEIAIYIAQKKAKAFDKDTPEQIVITADTIVTIDKGILGKPRNAEDAFRMLKLLSGREHEVITGVCLLFRHQLISFYDTTHVWFKELTDEQIQYYITNYKPYDKAGGYGIQEWIGLIAIQKIEGSYTNVVGLPTEKLFKTLFEIIN